ncbi:MAG: hypothetical protein RIS92_355 [Verrucomicrobiota bacterium]|jgi:hypothetical protein
MNGKYTPLPGVPPELDRLMRLENFYLWMGQSTEEVDKTYRGDSEWENFKASKYYPDRLDEWSDSRWRELGYDPDTYTGPRYE